MARQVRRSFRRSGRPARGMDWGGNDAYLAMPLNTSVAFWALSPFDVRSSYVDPTVIRHHLLPVFRTTAAIAANPGLLGIGVIAHTGDPDDATLPTVFPEPVTDPEADWAINIVVPIPVGAPTGTVVTIVTDTLIQSRAMRRLGNQNGLLVVAESFGVSGDVVFHYRFLLKE